MKDLDFDELDRAVNSLLTSNAAKPYQTEPEEKVVELGGDPTPTEAATPVVPVTPTGASTTPSAPPVPPTLPTPKPVVTPVEPAIQPPAPRPTTQPQPPLAGRRSTGQFMDVVHPSSDMRRNASTTPVSNPVNPQPTNPPVEVPAAKPIAPSTQSLPQPHISPNPAEVSENKLAEATPAESPFIAGTKVEKRPLGAFSGNMPQPEETEVTIQAKKQDSEGSQEKLPEELQDELLKIESAEVGTSEAEMDTTGAVPVETTEVSPVVEPNVQTQVIASIPQQYSEHPSVGEQDNGAIYDTESYHKALVSPKKKSGWLWVLWIVVLIVLGGAGGAAFFVYVLPNL